MTRQIKLQVEATAAVTTEFRGREAIRTNQRVSYGDNSKGVQALVRKLLSLLAPRIS